MELQQAHWQMVATGSPHYSSQIAQRLPTRPARRLRFLPSDRALGGGPLCDVICTQKRAATRIAVVEYSHNQKSVDGVQRFTAISLQSGLLELYVWKPRLVYPSEIKRERMASLEGFEPPTHGLGNQFPWNPLLCHKSSSKLRHKQLFRRSPAWAGTSLLLPVLQSP